MRWLFAIAIGLLSSAATADQLPEAPFAGLVGTNASRDGRAIFFQLPASQGRFRVPGHTQPYRLGHQGARVAALLISCRIPGPKNAVGPDPGHASAVIVFDDHPNQPDAWSFLDPRHWAAELFGFASQETGMSMRLPDGRDQTGTLVRRRASYGGGRPRLQLGLDPESVVHWLDQQVYPVTFGISATGHEAAISMRFVATPALRDAVRRMAVHCPFSLSEP
ncbi:MAG: hypothetical protein F4213_03180 [Boseongicola sp. SB0677_bin_26]|nr:hypothetical protein [Boseongicola sp. SB0665_bin_10]MYG25017.1 hypothetical protein [Boseongicola sp. SB0677_bin_26]